MRDLGDRLKALTQAYDTTPLPGQFAILLGLVEADAPVWLVAPEEVESAGVGGMVLGVTIDDLWLDETGAWRAPAWPTAAEAARARRVRR